MKVWIITARFGNGHFSAAKALEEEYKELGYEVVVSDIVEIMYPKLAPTIYGLFNHIICRSSTVYNLVNAFGRKPSEAPKVSSLLTAAFNRIKPDIIITTWSACGRKLGALPVPVYVCITDIGVHAGWVYPHAAGYLVATKDVAEKLVQIGVCRENIYVRGIPMKKVFYQLSGKAIHRKKGNNLLIMGGGLGILPWVDYVLDFLCEYPELNINIIAGNNKKLYHHLKNKYPFVTVVGFTDQVSSYLADADLLISKPGGVTLFESIYATTPCVAMLPTYQHELENADFIQKHQIGQVIWDKHTAPQQILELLENNALRRKYRANMIRVKWEVETAKQQRKRGYYEHAV